MGRQSNLSNRKAEIAAKTYLEMRGFHIIEQNWRRPGVEITIIAKKDGIIHFLEVNYRDSQQPDDIDILTASKIKGLQRSAKLWVEEEKFAGLYTLSAIEIGGTSFAVLGFTENVA